MVGPAAISKSKTRRTYHKGDRIRNNAMLSKDEGSFYRRVNRASQRIGKTSCMDEFVNFWGGIWENKERPPVQPWIDEIKERLREKIKEVKEFVVTEEELSKIVKKRKNWSAPGIDGVQNYWWKRFTSAQKALYKAFQQLQNEPSKIPKWFPLGGLCYYRKRLM